MERSIDLQRASQQLESLIADQKDRVSSYESLLERLDDLDNERPSSSSSSPFSIPLGPLAFVNGRIEKRDQLLVLLGANWFADMSVQRASGVAQRRLDIVKKRLGELQEDYSQLSTLVSNQQPESSRAAKATSSRSSAVTSVQDPLTQALEESGVNPNSLQDMAAARVDEHGRKIVDITEPIGDAEMKSLSTSMPSLDRSGPHGAFTSREQQQIASLFDQLELEEDSDEDENEADSDGDGNDTGSASESDDDEDDDDDGSSDGDDHNLRPTRKSAAGRRPIHQSKSTVDAGAVEAVKAQLRGTMPPKAVRMSSINLSGDGPALPSSSKPSAASTSHQARRVVDRTDAGNTLIDNQQQQMQQRQSASSRFKPVPPPQRPQSGSTSLIPQRNPAAAAAGTPFTAPSGAKIESHVATKLSSSNDNSYSSITIPLPVPSSAAGSSRQSHQPANKDSDTSGDDDSDLEYHLDMKQIANKVHAGRPAVVAEMEQMRLAESPRSVIDRLQPVQNDPAPPPVETGARISKFKQQRMLQRQSN